MNGAGKRSEDTRIPLATVFGLELSALWSGAVFF
jgi:hypothetical protein